MLLLVIAMGLAQLALNVQPQIQDFAMLVIVYTVASAGERWASRLALVGGLCAAPLAHFRLDGHRRHEHRDGEGLLRHHHDRPVRPRLGARRLHAHPQGVPRAAGGAGRAAGARARGAGQGRGRRRAGPHRPRAARRGRAQRVGDGRAGRRRGYVMDTAPDQARTALETISTTGRQALAEMRRLLGVLRDGRAPGGGEYVPQPGRRADRTTWSSTVRGAGLPVDFKVEGNPRPLPSGRGAHGVPHRAGGADQHPQARRPDAGASVRLGRTTTTGSGCCVEDDGPGARRTSCTRTAARTAGARA